MQMHVILLQPAVPEGIFQYKIIINVLKNLRNFVRRIRQQLYLKMPVWVPIIDTS